MVVTPAKAGVQNRLVFLDSGFRRNDDTKQYLHSQRHEVSYKRLTLVRFATGLLMRETIDFEAPAGYLVSSLGVKADSSLVSLHPYTSVVPGVSVVALVT